MRLAFAIVALIVAALVPARAEIVISIDKSLQQMVVTVDGDPRYIWPVSTGTAGYETPSGNFQALSLARHHFSREWDDAPMPHSIFFTNGGHAIHGTFAERQLGTVASHGCVRLALQDAATLFELVKAHGIKNTRVTLVDDARLAAAHPDVIAAIAADELPAAKPRRAARAPRYADNFSYYRARPYGGPRYYRYGGGFPFFGRVW